MIISNLKLGQKFRWTCLSDMCNVAGAKEAKKGGHILQLLSTKTDGSDRFEVQDLTTGQTLRVHSGCLVELVVEPATDTNPKKAYGDLKAPVHLVPPILVLETSPAFGEGAKKYGPFNWRSKKVETMTYVGAIGRHLAAYADGEDIDPESTEGKSHLAGIAACVAILMDAKAHGTLIDNRVPGPAAQVVRNLVKKPEGQ